MVTCCTCNSEHLKEAITLLDHSNSSTIWTKNKCTPSSTYQSLNLAHSFFISSAPEKRKKKKKKDSSQDKFSTFNQCFSKELWGGGLLHVLSCPALCETFIISCLRGTTCQQHLRHYGKNYPTHFQKLPSFLRSVELPTLYSYRLLPSNPPSPIAALFNTVTTSHMWPCQLNQTKNPVP